MKFLLFSILFLPFEETIHITDALTIDAQYMPKGSMLEYEAMVFSIVDFAIVQNELELSGHQCTERIKYVQKLALEELDNSRVRHEHRHKVQILKMKELDRRVSRLQGDVEGRDSSILVYRIGGGVLIGAVVVLTTLLAVK